jgi:hypothetical protein
MVNRIAGKPQITPYEPEHPSERRDPEDRPAQDPREVKNKSLDKTLADSFPTSDPPSTIPDPVAGGSTLSSHPVHDQLQGLPAGSWAALSVEDQRIVGRGETQDQAIADAKSRGHAQLRLVRVGDDIEAPDQIAPMAS